MSASSTLRKSAYAAALAAAVAIAGCGQRGPLALPDSAKPIQRLDPNAARPAGAENPASDPQTPPADKPDDQGDDTKQPEK